MVDNLAAKVKAWESEKGITFSYEKVRNRESILGLNCASFGCDLDFITCRFPFYVPWRRMRSCGRREKRRSENLGYRSWLLNLYYNFTPPRHHPYKLKSTWMLYKLLQSISLSPAYIYNGYKKTVNLL